MATQRKTKVIVILNQVTNASVGFHTISPRFPKIATTTPFSHGHGSTCLRHTFRSQFRKLLKYLFSLFSLNMKGTQRDADSQGEVFHLLVHFSDSHSSLGQPTPKPTVQYSIEVSMKGKGSTNFSPIGCALARVWIMSRASLPTPALYYGMQVSPVVPHLLY